nr:hypothetical protein [Rhizobium leguminosarum]
MQATVQTNMRREIDEIPEAATRLLDPSANDFAAAGAPLHAEDSAFAIVARGSSDHAAMFLKCAVELGAKLPVASIRPSLSSTELDFDAARPCQGSHARRRHLDRSDEYVSLPAYGSRQRHEHAERKRPACG